MSDLHPATPTLQLSAALDRPLVHDDGDSVRFLVVEVTAPTLDAPAAPKAPLNLALVVDASGSMEGPPIAAAKEAARRVAGALGADDRLSVVSFDSRVRVHVDGERQDAGGRAAAEAAILSLAAGSSTFLSGGWLAGCACAAKVMEATPGLRNHVVVLSDGQANAGILAPDELASHAAALRQRGLASSAVGIGADYSDQQLEAIAASGGGRLHHAAEAEEIGELVLGELDALRATVVESCELRIDVPNGIRAEVIGDYAISRPGGRLACVVGSLASGARRTVVFKLTCPAGERGARLRLDVVARWTAAGASDAAETAPVTATLQFASGKQCAAQPRDAALALQVARAWQFGIVRAATRLNQDGELERAADLVERELHHFERYCAKLAGAKDMLVALKRLRASIGEQRYAPMMAKEMLQASVKGTRGELDLRKKKIGGWETNLPG